MTDNPLRAEFARLLEAYGNTAELSRRSGLSVRALTYKRDGERRVTQWDCWALKQALREKQEGGEAT